MAYKGKVVEQIEFDYEYFLRTVEFIEKNFKDEVAEKISGKYIYVLLDGIFECTRFIKTTVSDIRSVCGDIDIDCMVSLETANNICLYSLKEPSKKSFRGILKYVPKGTLALSGRFLAEDESGNSVIATEFFNLPVLQDEKFLISACDELFENDEDGADYDFIERNAFKFLHTDKRISCIKNSRITPHEQEVFRSHSKQISKITSLYYDIINSWGISYCYANNWFIFPMKRQYIQEVFKKRDKENGRRKTIASIVNGYTRKNGSEVDGHLRSADTFTIDGRTFGIFCGSEDWDKVFPDTDKSRKRLRKTLEKSIVEKRMIIVNKK